MSAPLAPLASTSGAGAGPRPVRPLHAARAAQTGGRLGALGLGLGLGLAALGASAPAFAQSDAAVAEELFRRGRALMNQNRVAEACAKFTDSHRLDPKLGTLLNLAVCHEKEGKTASAWAEFVEAASQATRVGQAERSRFARSKAQELEKHLVRVEFRVDNPAPEQTLSLGSKALPASAWGVPVPVDPGTYGITANAPRKQAWTGELVVPDKAPAAVIFHVPALADEGPAPAATPPAAAAPAAPPAPAPEPGGGPGWRLPAALVAGSVGLAGLAIGAVFGLRTLAKESDADKECQGRLCSARGLDLHDDARGASTVSTAGFAVGVVGVGLGTFFWLSGPGAAAGSAGATRATGAGARGPVAAPAPAPAIGWAPRFGRQGLGLQVEGTW